MHFIIAALKTKDYVKEKPLAKEVTLDVANLVPKQLI